MTETLRKLIELQTIDAELYLLNRQMTEIPKSLRIEQTQYETVVKEVHREGQTHLHMDEQRKKMETELLTEAEHMKQLKGKQGLIKKNVEFQALTQEIKQAEETGKRHRLALEQQVESRKNMEERLEEKRKIATAQKDELLRKAEMAKKEIGALQEKIARQKIERNEFAKQVNVESLALYSKLLKTRAPNVVVPVRRSVCTGCHIKLPTQVIADIMKADRLVVCDTCARILYLDTSAAEAAAE